MTKKILIILGIWIIASIIFGITYTKNNPKPKRLKQTPITTNAKMAKEPFKSIGKEISQKALENNEYNFKPFINKMKARGANNILITTHLNQSPVSKTLPPVIIGGKTHKNKVKCSIVSYEHKNKKYEVGTCK